ncbi:MAG: chemotaxis response regulator protein-glutamate methylesterase [Thermodesulfobacteriota bacterium]
MENSSKKIRVLVVDDSALMRKMIPLILKKDPGIEVVGTAVDGIFALKKVEKFRPDVITLDMEMPGMDGLTTLKHIMARFKTPVVVVSSLTTKGARITMQAFELGAMDVVAKPQDAISVHIQEIAEELITKVRAVSRSSTSKLYLPPPPEVPPALKVVKGGRRRRTETVVAIGISTGGPNALAYMLPHIPADFPAALLIVQHMPAGFTEVFASRLNKICKIEVKEANEGDMVLPGRALIAPGGKHLKIKRMRIGTIAVLSTSAPVNGHRPSADVLFESACGQYGHSTVGVIMTGMGQDGAECLGNIQRAGGITIAQDEQSSIVFGMPKVAIEKGHARRVVPLEKMAGAIMAAVPRKGEKEYVAAK